MTITAKTLVPEQLWQAIQPLLPPPLPRHGGRPRVDDRAALAGIIDRLHTGIPWRVLPTDQLGCGSPVTCWRRLRDWQRAGVWQQLQHEVLAVPPVRGPRGRSGRPGKRPAKLHGDKGYDDPRCRRALRQRGIRPRIARRGIEPRDRRYVVERSLAWLVGYQRLQVRYGRRSDLLLGFLHLAGALICLKSPRQPAEGLCCDQAGQPEPCEQGRRAQTGNTQVGLGVVRALAAGSRLPSTGS